MGFGTLFIGYFFLVNFAYCEFTDALAAAIMMYALFKLSRVNDGFRIGACFSIIFTLFGVFELGVELYEMFMPISENSLILTLPALVRHLILAALTAFILIGIRDVAHEVGLSEIKKKSTVRLYVTLGVYILNLALESATLAKFIPMNILAVLYVLATLAMLIMLFMNLTVIFTAYMRICMPEDTDMKEKKSKSALVNAFRAHEEEKSREYAEYQLQKSRSKAEKKIEGKKKKL